MRDLSDPALAAIYAPRTDEVFLELITISHPDLATPQRLVNDRVDIVSRGETYTAFPFEARLQPSRDGELPTADLVSASTAELVDLVRSLEAPPDVAVELIMASSPDTVEQGPFNFTATEASYDATSITLQLAFEALLSEPYPSGIFSPATFPGMFQSVTS